MTWPGTNSNGVPRTVAEFVPMASREVKRAEVDVTGIDTGERIRNAIPVSYTHLDVYKRQGKKRMKQVGVVEVPQEAFMSILKLD